MRIVYGVMGYGRGHATRVSAVLPELMKNHEVLVLAGGDAYELMKDRFPVQKIPMLTYVYRDDGEFNVPATINLNLRLILSIFRKGPAFRAVLKQITDFKADVIISDADMVTHCAARELNIPRIGFDHYGVMVYGKPSMSRRDRWMSHRDIEIYKLLMGRPSRVMVSSFFPLREAQPGVEVVGTLLRDEVKAAKITDAGHVLVYFNAGDQLFRSHVEAAFRAIDKPVIVYGTSRRGSDGNLQFKAPSAPEFLADMASCTAIVSTAGNQLVGEAMYLQKPMMVMPDDAIEQRVNGAAVEELGLGERIDLADFSAERVQRFLARLSDFEFALKRHACDGREKSVEILERFIAELVGSQPVPEPAANIPAAVISILPPVAAAGAIGIADDAANRVASSPLVKSIKRALG